MGIRFGHTYEDIISVENLLLGWREFVRGKRTKRDAQEFQYRLMDNALTLHHDLVNKTYLHGAYHAFNISDPKPRNIHKASVRDRIVHHALYRKLYPFFDCTFIADSCSCRNEKGTHGAMNRFRSFAAEVSRNHTRTCWVLKCDVRKFFASIDHNVFTDILRVHISDEGVLSLVECVIDSFETKCGKGLPLGNLTSQLFVNIYMNEFDQFVKHALRAKYYIRYADDFVMLSHEREWLVEMLPLVEDFLCNRLKLSLHPQKVSICTIASGIDFLGWVHFLDHRVLRTSTKRRMRARIAKDTREEVIASYKGLLKNGNAHDLATELE